MRKLASNLSRYCIGRLMQGSIFQSVSAALASFSLFSMMQQFWQFGISSILADLLIYYRALAHWLFSWVGWPWAWRLPLSVRELLSLQLLCSGVLLRSGAIRHLTVRSLEGTFKPAGRFFQLLLILTPLSIFTCYSSLIGILTEPFMEESSGSLSRQVRPFLIWSVAGLILLFAINAYGLSVATL